MDWRRVFCWLNYPKHRDTEFDVGKTKEVTAKIVFCLIGYDLVDFLFVLKFLGNVGYVFALFVCFVLLRLHPFNGSHSSMLSYESVIEELQSCSMMWGVDKNLAIDVIETWIFFL